MVHSDVDGPGQNSGFRAALRSLLGLPREAPQRQSRMHVHVFDLQGHDVRCVDTLDRLVELPLPPATYDVIVRLGTVRRCYTMTLASGATCDLHLRLGHAG